MLESTVGFWSGSKTSVVAPELSKTNLLREMLGQGLSLDECEIWGEEALFLLPVIL